MQEIFKAVSTNGRWGLCLVSETETKFPAKGTLTFLGTFEGLKTYKFTPSDVGVWVYATHRKAVPLSGATVIEAVDLQSGQHATLLGGGDFFAITAYGYQKRSSDIRAFNKGEEVQLPPTVMAAMGLIPNDAKPVEVEIPELDSPIAEALRKAGIV